MAKHIKPHVIPLLIIILTHFLAIKLSSPILFDSSEYLSISQNIIQNQEYSISAVNSSDFKEFNGESPTRMRQPVYPLFLSLFYWSLGENIIFVLTVQLLCNICSYFLLYEIALLTFGNDYFNGSRYFISLYFPFWMLSALILGETVFSLLLIISIYLFIKGIKSGNGKFIFFAGTLLGFAFLTRPIALLVTIIICAAYLVLNSLRNSKKNLSLIFIGFLIIITPWLVRNYCVLGDLTPISSDGGYNFYCASLGMNEKPWVNSEQFREIVGNGYYLDRNASERFIKIGLQNFSQNPLSFLLNGIKRIYYTWLHFPGSRTIEKSPLLFLFTKLIQLLILVLAVIGFLNNRNKPLIFYILAPALGFTIIFLFSYSTSRFLVPIMPFVILLSGQGVYFLVNKIKLRNFSMDKSIQ